MAPVVLACVSAVLFGATSVAIRLALRRSPDPELGALTSAAVGFVICVIAIVLGGERVTRGALPFLLAGCIAPGISQILFYRAVRDAGAARTSVLVGTAPLFSVAIAIVALDEPVRAALVAGALLIVLGGLVLAGERVRPEDFRRAGAIMALTATVCFASRDNAIRWLSGETNARPFVAAAATLLGGLAVMTCYVLVTRRGRLGARLGPVTAVYFPANACFGLSYVALFDAYYRGRVTVVSPLVATESLWGVLLAVTILGRSELIGRHLVLGAALIVAGGALIGAFR